MVVPDDPSAGGRAEGSASAAPGSSLPARLALRVEEIVRAAEREAAAIQCDLEAHRQSAELELQRYKEDARRQAETLVHRRMERMRELTDELVERAEATRRHFDALIAALDRATARLVQDSPSGASIPAPARPAQSQRAGTPRPPERPDQPPREAERAPRPAADPLHGFDANSAASLESARLVAIEMAVAGRTRGEVDAHLRDAFRITDTAGLLDDVFGGGGGEATRTTWGTP